MIPEPQQETRAASTLNNLNILYICAVPSMPKGATIANIGLVAR
jgi:hypothetical protein